VIFQKLSNLSSVKNTLDNNWQLTFSSDEDVRSKIFDLAQENNLKILGLTTQNKNLETFFREVTI
jgi:ABC-2 type transport system ATP-binding protein